MNFRDVEILPNDIREALERPDSFIFHSNDEKWFSTWSLGPVMRTRDSSLLDESNAGALLSALEDAERDGEIEPDSWEVIRCNHWAVGWVDHLAFRVILDDGAPSNVFRFLTGWNDMLAEYPVADEEDYSRREYDEAIETIEMFGRHVIVDKAPEGWPALVFSWLWEHSEECFNGDENTPSEQHIKTALTALGLAEDDEE